MFRSDTDSLFLEDLKNYISKNYNYSHFRTFNNQVYILMMDFQVCDLINYQFIDCFIVIYKSVTLAEGEGKNKF